MFKHIILAVAMLCSTLAVAEPVKNGIVGILHAADMPFIIAREKGMFKSRGIDMAPDVSFSNNATVQVALTTNEVNIAGTTALFNIIQSRYNTAGVVWVRAINKGPGVALYAKSDIKSIADLKGRKVSAGGLNDNTRLFTEIILAQGGLKFEDVEWFWSGSTANRVVALQSGQIDAAMLWPPFNKQAENSGFKSLGVTSNFKMIANKGLAVNEDWARKNPATVNGISAALSEAAVWLYDPENLDEAAQILSTYTKTTVEDSKEGIQFYITNEIYERTADVFKKDIDYYVQIARDWKTIKPDQKLNIENLIWEPKNLK
jgi:ABC-type nitrate/sulfonate/bicarbonate transport system substrate-binding protein